MVYDWRDLYTLAKRIFPAAPRSATGIAAADENEGVGATIAAADSDLMVRPSSWSRSSSIRSIARPVELPVHASTVSSLVATPVLRGPLRSVPRELVLKRSSLAAVVSEDWVTDSAAALKGVGGTLGDSLYKSGGGSSLPEPVWVDWRDEGKRLSSCCWFRSLAPPPDLCFM